MKSILSFALMAFAAAGVAWADTENENMSLQAGNFHHQGLDYSVSTGFNVHTEGGGGNVPVEFTVSKRFSSNFSLGAGAGAHIFTSGSSVMIPVYASARFFIPPKSSAVTPFAEVRAGGIVGTSDNIGSGMLLSVMPGVRFPLSATTDIDLGVGYQHYVMDGGVGAVMLKVGLNFHAVQNPNRIDKPRNVVPVYDRGLEIGIEGEGVNDWGGALVVGYKFSSRFSLGIGVGAGLGTFTSPEANLTYYSETDGSGQVVGERQYGGYNHDDCNRTIFRVFMRGQYRVLDRKFSPIASVDLGYYKNSGDDVDNYFSELNAHLPSYDGMKVSNNGFFCRPMAGVSMRIGSNSYIELKAGADLLTKRIDRFDEMVNYSGSLNSTPWDGVGNDKYKSVRGFADGTGFSGFIFTLGWKHTFSVGEK